MPSGGVDEDESSLLGILSPQDAKLIVDLAAQEERSILDFLGQDQTEEVLVQAAIRETREEVGWEVLPQHVERLIPGALRGAIGHAGQTHNVFYGYNGRPSETKHDDGEQGTLTHDRFSIEDAVAMIGYEIVEPATTTAITSLAHMYGVKPTWLPSVKNRRKHY